MRILFAVLLVLSLSPKVFAMEEAKYLSDKKLSVYSAIIIKDFDTKNVDIEHIDADEMKELEPMMPKLVKMITTTIENKLKDEKKFAKIYINDCQETKGVVRVEGKIAKLNGGIGGVKFMLGIFTPKSARTYIIISGRLVDVETGNVIATFSETNTGMMMVKNFADYFPEMSEQLGDVIADFILDNY
jgi:hypothetical protein